MGLSLQLTFYRTSGARSSLVEQTAHNRLVVGSIPTGPTILLRFVSEAPDLGGLFILVKRLVGE